MITFIYRYLSRTPYTSHANSSIFRSLFSRHVSHIFFFLKSYILRSAIKDPLFLSSDPLVLRAIATPPQPIFPRVNKRLVIRHVSSKRASSHSDIHLSMYGSMYINLTSSFVRGKVLHLTSCLHN